MVPGAIVCHSPEEAAKESAGDEKVFVIGGGTVYSQMLPLCKRAYITKVHTTVSCDTFFPDLDSNPQWKLDSILESGEENGISYEMVCYVRV